MTSIAAVTENRAGEVGLAIYTHLKGKMSLSQLIDSALYSKTV